MAELLAAVNSGNLAEVNQLLAAGADPNTRDRNLNTPLILAVRRNNINILQALLQHRADPNLVNDMNFTPLVIAVRFNHINMVRLLLDAGADPNILPRLGPLTQSTLHTAAADRNSIELVELLLPKMNLENLEAVAIRARNAEFTPEINELILNYTKTVMDRRRFNKLIGATPVQLQNNPDAKYGIFNKTDPGLLSTIIGPFIGPKIGGRRRRHRKTKKRTSRRRAAKSHKRRA
jgi:ankyrin repeat protein